MIRSSLLALALVLVPAAGEAQSADRLALKLVKPTGNLPADIEAATEGDSGPLGAISGALSSPTNPLAKPLTDLANFIGADASGAAALAVEIPELQDVNGQACWIAMETAAKVFKVHPVPATLKLMTDHEAVRLLVMAANKLCGTTACTVVFADAVNVTKSASPIPITVPSLQSLCSKVATLAPPIVGLTVQPASSDLLSPVPVLPGTPNITPSPVLPGATTVTPAKP
jgi:hypothetical protein